MEYEGLLWHDHKHLVQGKIDEIVELDLPILISSVEDGAESGLQRGGADRDGPVRVASIGGLSGCGYCEED